MSRLYKTVKDYSKAVGVLPPVVLFKLDLWSETLSFSDVYKALPQSMKHGLGRNVSLSKRNGKSSSRNHYLTSNHTKTS